MFGQVAAGFGEFGAVVESIQVEGQVSQAGRYPGCDAYSGLARIFQIRDIPAPMQGILNFPMSSDPDV